MSLHIEILSIPASDQRYETAGDWLAALEDDPRSVELEVRVSQMKDWRYEFLVAFHELVEAALCKASGVSQRDVDHFDRAMIHLDEPGDDPRAPYHKEHMLAMQMELSMSIMLGVDWDKYNEELSKL